MTFPAAVLKLMTPSANLSAGYLSRTHAQQEAADAATERYARITKDEFNHLMRQQERSDRAFRMATIMAALMTCAAVAGWGMWWLA